MFNDNRDFYPTPEHLIQAMVKKINFKRIRSVLEPSAGKGDLAKRILEDMKGASNNKDRDVDLDVIEKDQTLQHILKGEGYRLVHDDFLTLNTFKKYDAIIMNPPFSSGDKHLLKALEMQQSGGEILCLLNAETLKNPYSNTRKDVLQKLEQYDAVIDFIEEGFKSAERTADVDVALVYINIPKKEQTSLITERLKKAEPKDKKGQEDRNDVIPADFIEGIVQQYNYEVRAGLKLIEEYNALKPLMAASFHDDYRKAPVLKMELEYKDEEHSTLENAYIKQIRLKYWKALFNSDQFMGLFTSNLKRKYMEEVEKLKDYDFSYFNIYTIRIELSKEMIKGVEETILNLFDEFSHRHHYSETCSNIHLYNGWKTNKAYKINRKVIIPLSAFDDFWGTFNLTGYKVTDKLKDIEKVFNYLDGGLTEELDMEEALKRAQDQQETKKIDLKYFSVTFYKKGTCHIEFKNKELLHKFNLFGSERKGWLPPCYGKKNYDTMTKEEQEVVQSFEGETSYQNVMKHQSYYFVEREELLKITS
ncbi:DUF4942 domain-containing protein (plasmid) [Pontibacillus sp. ALD_SL1]|uniref:class I SAM-dependent methyltransferase n=1 Tax=Pontibacillus sp. ALD_SL1 TaxID=2777185 RepID=UPI001A968A69|nr:DUF4942 domain-containing protein [Pontibacillus sp. ALD_SL1]QST02792.1 DUF4942 domain-containing protein [Pontibacillus sp. ALD_SL1]